MQMLIDVAEVKTPIKPKATSTLRSMRKDDLIVYIRTLEHNYNAAISFNQQQAENFLNLNGTQQQPNAPLTMDELRKMDMFSPPIWDNILHEWCAVRPNAYEWQKGVSYIGGGCRPLEANRFYRRKPEGG